MLNPIVLGILAKFHTGLARFSPRLTIVVFSIIRLYPSGKQRSEVIDLLRSVQDLTRPMPGCLGCWLSEEDFSHNHIGYVEQWESEEALHNHLRSDLYRRVLAAMELSRQPPEVSFYHASEKQGFELVEAVRSCHSSSSTPPSRGGSKLSTT
jgi:quinol monooxygenase YgiN